jgi:hypothetical protein
MGNMGIIFSAFFTIILVGLIAVLIFALFRYTQREKLVEGILARSPKSRNRFLSAEKQVVSSLAVFLWSLPFDLVVLLLSLYLFLRPIFIIGTIIIVLIALVCLQEYLFRKWLIAQIAEKLEHQENPS